MVHVDLFYCFYLGKYFMKSPCPQWENSRIMNMFVFRPHIVRNLNKSKVIPCTLRTTSWSKM